MAGKPKPLEHWYIILKSGCWHWVGQQRGGYGLYWYQGVQYQAHRFLYENYKKKIEAGKDLDHLCRSRACVNPDHMEEVTSKENVQRGLIPSMDKDKVKELRLLYDSGEYTQKDLALRFNISQPTVSQIVRGVTW